MKKVMILAGLILATTVVNAQVFLGGSLSVGFDSQKDKDGNKTGTTTTSFGINPMVGYALSDKWDVGLDFGFNSANLKDEATSDKTTISSWKVAPFARYSFLKLGQFKLQAKASLSFAGSQMDFGGGNKSNVTNIDFIIAPYLAYDVNQNVTFFVGLNYFNLDYGYQKVKDGGSSNGFNLNVDTNNVANTNNFQVGFEWHF